MNSRQRQIVLFVGFMFIFSVAMIILFNNTGAEGISLGEYVPESTKQFANNTTSTWSDIAKDAKNGSSLLG